ncbi:MAG: GGDEF domain-containing protein [Gammaproteobacteria bacterium]|nr:GGDEF domain-containing protein [Gammaproteobacteria bacterium]
MPSTRRNETASAAKAMAAIVAIVFVTELLVMALLSGFGYATGDPDLMALDSIILAILTAPPIYRLVLIPLRREYEKRLAAESAAENLSKLAITDPLTRIMNRRGITVALLDAMAQSERYSAPLCVAMADIDHFKQVNDTHGHKAGDQVLTEIAGIFSDTLRMPDKVGRYGGEEFLIILPHTTLAGGRKIAERLRAAVNRWQFGTDGKKLKLTVSLGITQARKGEDMEQLLARVDQALYAAKNGGRNLVVVRKTA